MNKGLRIIMIAGSFACAAVLPLDAYDRIKKLDLTAHDSADKADIKQVSPELFEWSLPTPISQIIHLDFNKLGIDPSQYDEIRFDIQPKGSQVGLHTILHGFPNEDTLSSWYLKFRTPVDQWTSGRYELRVDDDGVFIPHGTKRLPKNMFTMRLSRRVVGSPGEPTWRKALIRNPRLVRNIVKANFDLLKTTQIKNKEEVAFIYHVNVKNRDATARSVIFEADSRNTLKYFKVTAPDKIELKPGEERIVEVKLSLGRGQAESLPPLYSEPCFVKVSIEGMPDSDYSPVVGFRATPLWAVVPILNKHETYPVETMAYLAAREKAMPGIAELRKRILNNAAPVLKKDWPVYSLPMTHSQQYRCKACEDKLRPVDETKLNKHICPKCKKIYSGDPVLDAAYATHYRSNISQKIGGLAQAYQISGEEKYAEKAIDIFFRLATKYPDMPIRGFRSTSAGTKIGYNSLFSSWTLPILAEAYHNLKTSSALTDEKEEKIVSMLNEEAWRVSRHSVEYSNMQAEHIRAYGTVGLATGFWPLVGEAIGGEFGWHEVVEFGYSEDGVSHEAGAYHRAIFGAMTHFSDFAYEMGANLLTPRFKRVFDGSVVSGMDKGVSYELAYRIYRDPAYLPVLIQSRKKVISHAAAFLGILGLPEPTTMPVKSSLFKSAGYAFLRKGTASDNIGMKMNYIKAFDRTEYDKFQTRFYRNDQPIDDEVGRITYGSDKSKWMYKTAAHSVVVVDGRDQRSVDGKLVAFDDSPAHPVVVAGTDEKSPFYEGVEQIRGIALLGDFYVVFDRLKSESPRCFDRYQYGKGKATLSGKVVPVEGLSHIPAEGDFKNIVGLKKERQGTFCFENGLAGKIVCDQDFRLCKATTIKGHQPNPCETVFARVENVDEVTFLAVFSLEKKKLPTLKILENDKNTMTFQVGEQILTVHLDNGKVDVK